MVRLQYTYSSGTLDATAATLYFSGGANVYANPLITGGGAVSQFGNLQVGDMDTNQTFPNTVSVNGSLTFSPSTTGSLTADFSISGDVIHSNAGFNGSGVTMTLNGTNSNISRSSTNIPTGTVTVSKTAGQKVSLIS